MSSNQRPIPLDAWTRIEGSALPLGATWLPSEQAYNFSIYSKSATAVSLLLYQESDFTVPAKVFRFNVPSNKTYRVWHMFVPAREIGEAKYYGYRIDGPFNPMAGDRFDHDKILLDPYARRIFLPPDFSRSAASARDPNDGKAPLAILPDRTSEASTPQTYVERHTHDLVIYELHVRNFTRHSSSKLDDRLLCKYRPVQSVGQDRALSLSGSAPPPIVELDHPLYIKFQLCRNGSVRERRLTERPLYS